ncbi:MAG: hypothetical protein IT385_20185 [Deltaproteobacteria bacterium]|nr:hypothetical protein [Deltaproteobacteria bacterium]
MTYDEAAVESILEEMRRGHAVVVGGSRAHTTYAFRGDRWVAEAFDEGYVEDHAIDEAAVRDVIARDPDGFLPLLRAPHLRRFRAAFEVDDRPAARAALRDAGAWGDPHSHFVIWDAALADDGEGAPAPEVIAAMADDLRGHTAWHAFWDVVGWDRTPAHARRGLWFLDRLMAIARPDPLPPAVDSQRESFAKLVAGE